RRSRPGGTSPSSGSCRARGRPMTRRRRSPQERTGRGLAVSSSLLESYGRRGGSDLAVHDPAERLAIDVAPGDHDRHLLSAQGLAQLEEAREPGGPGSFREVVRRGEPQPQRLVQLLLRRGPKPGATLPERGNTT